VTALYCEGMLVNTKKQLEKVNPIDLSKEIETIFHLDTKGFLALPLAMQVAILAKAKHAHDYAPIYNRNFNGKAVK